MYDEQFEEEDDGIMEEEWQIKYEDLEFGELVGKGSFGRVYKGEYFGTEVAIKQVLMMGMDPELTKKYVRREVNMLRVARHPNIVSFMGYCNRTDANELYIITEWIGGGNLTQLLRDPSISVPWRRRVLLARDVALSVLFLHQKGLIHRDLKSENLLLTENYNVKLCDFGFARKMRETAEAGAFMTLGGTEDYMAPECILGEEYDNTCDVFSFGVVLWELIRREKPPKRGPPTAFGFEHRKKLKELIPPDCPSALGALFLDCVEYYPEGRPSFKEILTRLKDLLQELPRDETNTVAPSLPQNKLRTNSPSNEETGNNKNEELGGLVSGSVLKQRWAQTAETQPVSPPSGETENEASAPQRGRNTHSTCSPAASSPAVVPRKEVFPEMLPPTPNTFSSSQQQHLPASNNNLLNTFDSLPPPDFLPPPDMPPPPIPVPSGEEEQQLETSLEADSADDYSPSLDGSSLRSNISGENPLPPEDTSAAPNRNSNPHVVGYHHQHRPLSQPPPLTQAAGASGGAARPVSQGFKSAANFAAARPASKPAPPTLKPNSLSHAASTSNTPTTNHNAMAPSAPALLPPSQSHQPVQPPLQQQQHQQHQLPQQQQPILYQPPPSTHPSPHHHHQPQLQQHQQQQQPQQYHLHPSLSASTSGAGGRSPIPVNMRPRPLSTDNLRQYAVTPPFSYQPQQPQQYQPQQQQAAVAAGLARAATASNLRFGVGGGDAGVSYNGTQPPFQGRATAVGAHVMTVGRRPTSPEQQMLAGIASMVSNNDTNRLRAPEHGRSASWGGRGMPMPGGGPPHSSLPSFMGPPSALPTSSPSEQASAMASATSSDPSGKVGEIKTLRKFSMSQRSMAGNGMSAAEVENMLLQQGQTKTLDASKLTPVMVRKNANEKAKRKSKQSPWADEHEEQDVLCETVSKKGSKGKYVHFRVRMQNHARLPGDNVAVMLDIANQHSKAITEVRLQLVKTNTFGKKKYQTVVIEPRPVCADSFPLLQDNKFCGQTNVNLPRDLLPCADTLAYTLVVECLIQGSSKTLKVELPLVVNNF
ncbi:putative serine/threonine-protein kinase EDR1 [Balamuthia mandrillaris]